MRQFITEKIIDIPADFFEQDVENLILDLKNIYDKYADIDSVYNSVRFEQYTLGNYHLIGTRYETDQEYKDRLKRRKKKCQKK